jgi:hypothetical protein
MEAAILKIAEAVVAITVIVVCALLLDLQRRARK